MRAIIAGGGTGGHLFPAIALAEELRSRSPELSVLFIGVKGGMEQSLLLKGGWQFEGISASGLQGKPLTKRLLAVGQVPINVVRSRSILRQFSPDVVVGLGGYPSVGMLVAAVASRVPSVIHEQNALPGLANRWLGRIVDLVAVTFERTSGFFPKEKVRVTGNPVRADLFDGNRAEALARFGLESNRLTLLIFGGSQGAHRLNEALLEALPLLESERGRVQFLHATGSRDLGPIRQGYAAHGHRAVVEPFFFEMSAVYAAADLCLCRAGAGTVAELCALGKPSILVPFPFAADDHQRWNAESLVASGGALMVLDHELSGAAVAQFVKAFLGDREPLVVMGRKVQALARPDAAARLADVVAESLRFHRVLAGTGQSEPLTINDPQSTANRQP